MCWRSHRNVLPDGVTSNDSSDPQLMHSSKGVHDLISAIHWQLFTGPVVKVYLCWLGHDRKTESLNGCVSRVILKIMKCGIS